MARNIGERRSQTSCYRKEQKPSHHLCGGCYRLPSVGQTNNKSLADSKQQTNGAPLAETVRPNLVMLATNVDWVDTTNTEWSQLRSVTTPNPPHGLSGGSLNVSKVKNETKALLTSPVQQQKRLSPRRQQLTASSHLAASNLANLRPAPVRLPLSFVWLVVHLLVGITQFNYDLAQTSPIGSFLSLDIGHQPADKGQKQGLNLIDSACQQNVVVSGKPNGLDNEVEMWLVALKCKIKPIMDLSGKYLRAVENDPQRMADGTLGALVKSLESLEAWRDYAHASADIDEFYEMAMFVLSRRDFCTYSTLLRMRRLLDLAQRSKLLGLIYDLISIDLHSRCLKEVFGRMPPVPRLIKEVVDIYWSGIAEKLVQDLNEPSIEHDSFNVQAALAENGPLEQVMPVLLTRGYGVQDFKDSCKQFLIDIEQHWISMSIMGDMLQTPGNNIREYNNIIVRSLKITKYADACSQLSAAS